MSKLNYTCLLFITLFVDHYTTEMKLSNATVAGWLPTASS